MEAGRRVGHRGAAVLPRHTPPSQTGGEGVNRPHRIGHHASPPPRKILYPRRSYLFVLLGEGGAGVKPHSGKGRDLYWQAVGAGWMANPLRGRNGEAPPGAPRPPGRLDVGHEAQPWPVHAGWGSPDALGALLRTPPFSGGTISRCRYLGGVAVRVCRCGGRQMSTRSPTSLFSSM